MFNHEPPDYPCPFCLLITSGENELISRHDVVRQNERATAWVSPRWWPNNHGNVLVVPNAHYENLYDLPPAWGHAVHDLVREVAIAIRHTYDCAGVSTRQHNEPAGYQDVWHYHMHVFPRYPDDQLYNSLHLRDPVPAEARRPYVDRLRRYFDERGSLTDS
ncbi:HIT family protein [Actinopolymorpha alba]|uniref:HIT family protein n=1 Tax=Actinopolymorpha alba TaxID=533267 RepID=UPI00035D1877|nr:HIT family protein [Actinopolymorpha alba]